MAVILVYNNDTNSIERYQRNENEIMPYVYNNSLTVNEFRGSSNANLMFTDKRTMETWSQFRDFYGAPIPVGFAFKRIWEGGHSPQSQHYAGTAFDVGQALTPTRRNRLRQRAIDFGQWSYVEPAYLTPTWVHMDKRNMNPACSSGYPLLRLGDVSNYVLILQDALNALGYTGAGFDGIFGSGTLAAVQRFQQAFGIPADGIVGCVTWTLLTQSARGIGQTATVVSP